MSQDAAPIVPIGKEGNWETEQGKQPTMGDRLRMIVSQLRQEDEVQVRATARILGAAAKIAENHDRLIDEVVDMVEEDLNRAQQTQELELGASPYTEAQLRKQFPNLKEAKTHFGLKASSWKALVDKLNTSTQKEERNAASAIPNAQPTVLQHSDPLQRLDRIEQELQLMRGDLNQLIELVMAIAQKL